MTETIESSRVVKTYDAEKWPAYLERVRGFLIHAAVNRQFVTYSDLTTYCALKHESGNHYLNRGLPLATLLCELNHVTLDENGVMLSAIVVNKETGRPGIGFDDCRKHSNQAGEWQEQVDKVFARYAR